MSRKSQSLICWTAVILIAVIAPQVLTGGVAQNLAIIAILFGIVASNWDLTLGYAGIFNFAHVAFFGIGGYVSAMTTIHLGVPVWLDLVCAVLVVAAVAAIAAMLALRLRGIYVALVTFAFVQLCLALIVSQKAVTGGATGLVGVPDLKIAGFELGSDLRAYFYLVEILLIASTLFLRRLIQSDFGLSLIALRDNEEYALSRGIPATRQRVLAMVASSVFTAIAGAVYAHYLIVASPDVFSFSLTILILSMTLLGGTSTIYGPILAAIVITLVTEYLADWGGVRFMMIAVLIVLVLRFLPGGLWSLGENLLDRRRGATFR